MHRSSRSVCRCVSIFDCDVVFTDIYRLHLSPNYVSLVPEDRPWLDMTEMCHRIYNSTWTRDQLTSHTDTENQNRRLSLTVNGNQQSFTRHFSVRDGEPIVISQQLSTARTRRVPTTPLPPLPPEVPCRPTSFSSESGSSGDGVHTPKSAVYPVGLKDLPDWTLRLVPPNNAVLPVTPTVIPRSVPTVPRWSPSTSFMVNGPNRVDYIKRYNVTDALRNNASEFGDDYKTIEELYERQREKFKPKPRPAARCISKSYVDRPTPTDCDAPIDRSNATEIDCTITAIINQEPVATSPDPFDLSEKERDIFCVSLELLALNSIKEDEGGWEAFSQHVLHIDQDELESVRGFSYEYRSLKLSVILHHWHKMSQVAPHLCKEPPSRESIRKVLIKMKKFDVLDRLKWNY